MPLYTSGGITPNAVTFEASTPVAGQHPISEWDGWYDKTGAAITSGEADAVLAAMGLTYADGGFTATRDGIFSVSADFSGNDPGSTYTNSVTLTMADFLDQYTASWGDAPDGKPTGLTVPTAQEATRLSATAFVPAGDTFHVDIYAGDTAATAVSWIAVLIMRLA